MALTKAIIKIKNFVEIKKVKNLGFLNPPAPPFFKKSEILLKTMQCDILEVTLVKFYNKLIGRSLDQSAKSFLTFFPPRVNVLREGWKFLFQRVLLTPLTNFNNIGNIYMARFECSNRKKNRKLNFSKHDLTLKI